MPRLLDLFSGAGGAAEGYARAGFDVTGVDLSPQPRYPFAFIQADALAYLAEHGDEYDAIHASPPCQRYSSLTKMHGAARVDSHPDLIAATRELLRATGRPYIIENVPGAPLVDAVTLCGSMFGLSSGPYHLRRHRLFESTFPVWPPATCAHLGLSLSVYGHPGGSSSRDLRRFGSAADWRTGMGIGWMTNDELAEAIPPAYTEHVGAACLATLPDSRTTV